MNSNPVSRSAKARAAADLPPWKGEPLVRRGQRLVYEMEDFDDADGSAFLIRDTGATGERLSFEWIGAEGLGDSILGLTTEALESARTMLRFSQGSVSTYDGVQRSGAPFVHSRPPGKIFTDHLPPFLLCRDTLRALRSGAPFTVVGEWVDDREHPMQVVGIDACPVIVDGKVRKIPVVVAQGKEITLWIVNDERWPILVKREEYDNGWLLTRIDSAQQSGAPFI